jgi:hypothetical protein
MEKQWRRQLRAARHAEERRVKREKEARIQADLEAR